MLYAKTRVKSFVLGRVGWQFDVLSSASDKGSGASGPVSGTAWTRTVDGREAHDDGRAEDSEDARDGQRVDEVLLGVRELVREEGLAFRAEIQATPRVDWQVEWEGSEVRAWKRGSLLDSAVML